ncbi:MAG: GHMP kinase [Acholeplasmatales bacterium]|nr:GHMP kinase [Acholeplasmatales bacterium]
MIIRSKAPLRLGFAGGGTDVEPFCNEYGGCVLNVTINMYAHCTLKPRNDGKIVLSAPDMGEHIELDAKSVLEIDSHLPLHKGIYNRIVKDYNNGNPLSFEMTTYSDAPSGSGLGTSSTMVVCILKAFVEWLNLPLGEYDVARLAYDIERIDLGFAGGSQDQYAAVFGGLNFMEFYDNHKVIVNPLRLKKWIKNEMENSLVLYYTGKSHDSSKIILEQKKATENKKSSNFEGLLEIKKASYEMKEHVLTGNFKGIAETLNNAWIAKKKTSKAISNQMIDDLYNFAIANGAEAAKISGAGGGGVMMCWCRPENRFTLVEALKTLKNGNVFTVDFVEKGAQTWKLYDEED